MSRVWLGTEKFFRPRNNMKGLKHEDGPMEQSEDDPGYRPSVCVIAMVGLGCE